MFFRIFYSSPSHFNNIIGVNNEQERQGVADLPGAGQRRQDGRQSEEGQEREGAGGEGDQVPRAHGDRSGGPTAGVRGGGEALAGGAESETYI